jgi:nitrogen-specific signal transduction histidine kinase
VPSEITIKPPLGIPEEIRDRIFEPYFSTKGPDKGTGLGLSQVHGFVQQSGGVLTVDSKTNEGTTSELFCPEESRNRMPRRVKRPPLNTLSSGPEYT